jgi:hypothetical protein
MCLIASLSIKTINIGSHYAEYRSRSKFQFSPLCCVVMLSAVILNVVAPWLTIFLKVSSLSLTSEKDKLERLFLQAFALYICE